MDSQQTLKVLQSLTKVIDVNKIITPQDIEAVLVGITQVLNKIVEDGNTINSKTEKAIEKFFTTIKDQQAKVLSKMGEETAKMEKAEAKLEKKNAKLVADTLKKIEDLANYFIENKPENGQDADEEKIKAEILKQLPPPTPELTPEQVRDKLLELQDADKIPMSAIRGLEDALKTGRAGRSMKIGGGGVTQIIAGTGVTITSSGAGGRGVVTINASGGAGSLSVGDTIGSATQGSVFFAGASGVLAQNNNNFFWDDANTRLLIGAKQTDISALSSTVAVVKNGLAFYQAFGYGASGSTGGIYAGYGSGGVAGTPTAVVSGTGLVNLSGRGYDGTSWTTGSQGSVVIQTAENWSSTARGTQIQFDPLNRHLYAASHIC